MKNIIKFGCILIFAISCKAQTIVPVEKTINYMDAGNGIPNGTYLKDVNNLLSKYVGTWKGAYGDKSYTFFVAKYTYKPNNVTYDTLLIRYLITSSNGTILEDTRNLPNTDPKVIKGDYFNKEATYYVLNYFGVNSQCGNKGAVYIRMKNTENTQMSLTFVPEKFIMSEDICPSMTLANLAFPTNAVIRFTKQ